MVCKGMGNSTGAGGQGRLPLAHGVLAEELVGQSEGMRLSDRGLCKGQCWEARTCQVPGPEKET